MLLLINISLSETNRHPMYANLMVYAWKKSSSYWLCVGCTFHCEFITGVMCCLILAASHTVWFLHFSLGKWAQPLRTLNFERTCGRCNTQVFGHSSPSTIDRATSSNSNNNHSDVYTACGVCIDHVCLRVQLYAYQLHLR